MKQKKRKQITEKDIFVKDAVKYQEIVDRLKSYLKLADWEFELTYTARLNCSSQARIEIDMVEKKGTITVTDIFINKDNNAKANILLHELLHLKVSLIRQKLADLQYTIEEEIVNDLTRGFEFCNIYEQSSTDTIINSLIEVKK